MNLSTLLILGIAGGVIAHVLHQQYPRGKGPFENVPGDAGRKVASQDVETNGRHYTVTGYAVTPQNKDFNVAVQKGKHNWISYWHDSASNARAFYGAYAQSDDPAEQQATVTGMKADFGVT
jgi:hypothetical protein